LVRLIARITVKRKRGNAALSTRVAEQPYSSGCLVVWPGSRRRIDPGPPVQDLWISHNPDLRLQFDAEPLADGFLDQLDKREGVFGGPAAEVDQVVGVHG
jgi:hypothetical protein